jgi:hypothetical protein
LLTITEMTCQPTIALNEWLPVPTLDWNSWNKPVFTQVNWTQRKLYYDNCDVCGNENCMLQQRLDPRLHLQ